MIKAGIVELTKVTRCALQNAVSIAARAQAVAAGYPTDLVEALFDHTGPFTPQPVTDTVYEITGRVPRSIRQWALDHAEAFR